MKVPPTGRNTHLDSWLRTKLELSKGSQRDTAKTIFERERVESEIREANWLASPRVVPNHRADSRIDLDDASICVEIELRSLRQMEAFDDVPADKPSVPRVPTVTLR